MDDGHRKIRIWLTVMLLAAVLAGSGYYYAATREGKYESENTLVENAVGSRSALNGCIEEQKSGGDISEKVIAKPAEDAYGC